MASEEKKNDYREALKESLRKAESLVDDIFERIDGSSTSDITLSFHVSAGKSVTVEYEIQGNVTGAWTSVCCMPENF